MQGVVGNTAATVVAKAGVALGPIIAAEHLWKPNKPAAIRIMLASNGVGAIVAARNARHLRLLR